MDRPLLKDTPLMKALSAVEEPQPTPMEAFKVARRMWAQCKHISIGELAHAVGVSRVTLYRWVGSREKLVDEILWSYTKPTFEKAIKSAPGTGVDHILETHRRFMTDLARFEPMRRFLIDNPFEAIRIQTNDPSCSHGRLIQAVEAQLIEQEKLGYIELPDVAAKIAELIVFTNGALVYCAILGGRDTEAVIEQACMIDRSLLAGQFESKNRRGISARKKK
ncbi:MAG: QsdR family transcriptional regulator [Desulfobacteraceae bacterium]|nr:QsdR family transcriptional regulator [Desulfobacteraceae bacterium]